MKGKLLIILSGVALLHLFLLGGLALTGGCSSDLEEKAIDDQNFVPAPAAETTPATTTPAPAVTDFGPAAPTTGAGLSTPSPLNNNYQLPPIKTESLKYTVQKGDSLWKIAKKHGVSVDELASYNQLKSAKDLKVGQILTIPPGGKSVDSAEAAKPVSSAAKPAATKKHSATAAAPAPAKASAPAPALGAGETYAVQKGDTLDKIAHKFHVKAADIASANNMAIDKMLQIGQKLTIPKAGATAAKAMAKDDAVPKKGQAAKAETKEAEAKPEAAKPEAKPAKGGDPLLDEIPSPDGPAASPVASGAAVKSAADLGGDKAVASAASALTTEIDQDTTVDKLASQYGCKADDIRKLNPELSADGKIKAGSIVKIP